MEKSAGKKSGNQEFQKIKELVEQGKTGILVQAKSSESLYKGMKKFLHLSHQKREVMGKLGREKMEKEFRKEEVVEETMQAMGL